MHLTSPIFLLLFLPLALLSYYATPVKLRLLMMLILSSVFYLWGELGQAAVIFCAIIFNYASALLIEKTGGRTREGVFWGALLLNLAVLGWFKYSAFWVASLIAPSVLPDYLPTHLPIGISFFTFLAVAYLTDVRNGILAASRNLPQTALYFAFFPKVVAGPLVRFTDFTAATYPASLFSDDFIEGVRRFIIGLARKLLLATPLMKAADTIFSTPGSALDMPTAWLGAVLYALQIYHDFGGYSDMAIGLGLMFGYRLPENFDFPYRSLSFTEFWRRWHITLSGWIRDYLFYPLNRALITESFRLRLARGEANLLPRTCLSVCCAFVVCGMWHGATWNFALWGLVHGIFLAFEQTPTGKSLTKMPIAVRRFYLLGAIVASWVAFRLETVQEIAGYAGAMLIPKLSSSAPDVWTGELALVFALALLFAFPVSEHLLSRIPERVRELCHAPAYLLLFLLALTAVAGGAYNPFIYARF